MFYRRILAAALTAGLSQLVLVGSAVADIPKGLYLGLNAGLARTANLTYTTSYTVCGGIYVCGANIYNAVTYNPGYSAGAQLGYSFGGPRVELELGYRYNGANTIATPDGTQTANGSLTATNYMVNVLYDFDTGSRWIPYIGLGLGVADVSANNIRSSNPSVRGGFLDGSSSKFAAQFIFGVQYEMSQKVGVTLDWRGLWASNANFSYGFGCPGGGTTGCAQTGTTSYDYWNGALSVGVRIKF